MKQEQTTIFDFSDGGEPQPELKKGALTVVTARMVNSEQKTWQDLFGGFDELYVITYSSGIDFTNSVIKNFKHAEIIYGCPAVLHPGIAAIMEVQKAMIKELAKKNSREMAERVADGSLCLYVLQDTMSHEKIYCLRSKSGHTRVITGSANMSASAFKGVQRENILCFDDDAVAFDYYFHQFETLRNEGSSSVSAELFAKAVVNPDILDSLDNLPITKEIEKASAFIIDTSTSESDEEEAILVPEIKGHEKELRSILPKPKKEDSKIIIKANDLQVIKKKIHQHEEQKRVVQRVNPKLHIDYETRSISFNGKPFNMEPTKEQIANDVSCLCSYIDSLDKFNGDWKGAQLNYYKFLNWYFSSVFMAYMRYLAYKNDYEPSKFPVIGIIYGDSNGGKTTFIKLLTKLMCGKAVPANSSADFTATNIEGLKCLCEGLPIYIDDLAKNQYQAHCEKIIKNDLWGINDHRINYPAVAITTNKLPSVTADISKRAVTCRINTRISNEAGTVASKRVNDAIKNATNALFCAYARKMFDRIAMMAEEMKQGSDEYFPDIFKESSDMLKEIISECVDGTQPAYVQDLNYFSYFGDKAIGRNAISKIRLAWENNPEQFRANKKKNILVYNFAENSKYDIKYILDELPPTLNAEMTQKSLVMNLKEAQSFFGYRFKHNIFGKVS